MFLTIIMGLSYFTIIVVAFCVEFVLDLFHFECEVKSFFNDLKNLITLARSAVPQVQTCLLMEYLRARTQG